MSGPEQLRDEDSERTAAVDITAYDDEQVRCRAEAAGVVGLFLKPFDNRQLRLAVE